MEKIKNQKSNKDKVGGKRITEISKALSYLLRHAAQENNLTMDSKGYALLDDVINSQPIKKHKASREMIYQAIEENNKKRFELLVNDKGVEYIRAVQGHTMEAVKNEEALDLIENIYEFPTILHGTYFEPWEFIKKTGLNKMSRNTIHFAIGESKDNNVISGMRGNCELYVEINGPLCVANNIPMFISKNKVVLSPGINGVIDPIFFKRVLSTKGSLITACEYDQIIVPIITVSNSKTFGLDDQISVKLIKILVINLKSSELKYSHDINLSLTNENGESLISKLNEFSSNFIEKSLNKYSTILALNKNIEKYFTDYLVNLTKQDKVEYHLKHPSLYSEYIQFDIDSNNFMSNSDLIEDNKLLEVLLKLLIEKKKNFSGENIIKYPITVYSEQLDKLSKDEYYNKNKDLNEEKNSDKSKSKPLPFKKQVLKDVKEAILNSEECKNYIVLFNNYDEEEDLDSVDYCIVLNSDFTNGLNFFKSETTSSSYNNTQTVFIQKFMDEMRDNLVKLDIFDKLLILAGSRSDISYLTQRMKKASYKIPNIFQNNVIELFPKDFDGIEAGNMKEAIELFYLLYLKDSETIKKKIKIINNV